MGHCGISIVALACRFADATSPDELWRNVVSGRQSFRRIPPERLDLTSYAEEVRGHADSIYPVQAGLLTNWTFDRHRFRIPHSTFVVTDPVHWLALELSSEAIASLGGPERFEKLHTAVVVANTLTGDASRSAILRQRAPFLEGIIGAAAVAEGLPDDVIKRLQARLQAELVHRLQEPNEDSLAGGLANTIAGRIANYFDFKGGGYVVDGACASSLVALADAANLITTGQADAVVVTAVDLSIDPFELIGFSRADALAREEVRIFDERAAGFWPGEGGATVILMRDDEAKRRSMPQLARLLGWAISSDGAGGMTRPTVDGQELACRRAYERADVDPADLDFVEAHGTGTRIGDRVEIMALSQLLAGSNRAIPVGSIKGNIGHTKAAAGLAGLTKAVMALRHRAVAPHVGCIIPSPAFVEAGAHLRPAQADSLADSAPGLAGVSAFGFGGINAHVVLKGAERTAQRVFRAVSVPPQDAELFVFSGGTANDVLAKTKPLAAVAATLSRRELVDAAFAAWRVVGSSAFRVAVVAGRGEELAEALTIAARALERGEQIQDGRVFVSAVQGEMPRIGFLFPGQGGGTARTDGGIWRRRFPAIAHLLERQQEALSHRSSEDARIQSGTVAASLAAASTLEQLGIFADVGVGHSLGEISAIAWAGALEPEAALEFAASRGQAMAEHGIPGGGMLAIRASRSAVDHLIDGNDLVIACVNGPEELVLAGAVTSLDRLVINCRSRGIACQPLDVRNAFHSPHMLPASGAVREWLETFPLRRPTKPVVSTILGSMLDSGSDIAGLLVQQLISPVRFDEALRLLAAKIDMIIEVGPASGLPRLVERQGIRAASVDAFGLSMRPLLKVLASVFCAGGDVDLDPLFADRDAEPITPARQPDFLGNPCGVTLPAAQRELAEGTSEPSDNEHRTASDSLLNVVLAALEAESGLPRSAIGPDERFLDALHLNSLAVARVVRAVATKAAIVPPASPTDFANATARELAVSFEEIRDLGPEEPNPRVQGVRRWVRPFRPGWVRAPDLSPRFAETITWQVIRIGSDLPSRDPPDGATGLLICLNTGFDRHDAMQLIRLARSAVGQFAHLAIVHNGAAVGGFARSVAADEVFRSVRVIDRAGSPEDGAAISELLNASTHGYVEARVGPEGLEIPSLIPSKVKGSGRSLIDGDDVVVVIGGGRGIVAECALRLGGRGAQLVLVGRSATDDPQVFETLRRAAEQGLRCRYVRADVLDRTSFAKSLGEILGETGPATALIYAAGVNQPAGLASLADEWVDQALAAKIDGLKIATEALGEHLRTLITFGSLIGRVGLEGEAHYALGNAMQTAATLAWEQTDARRSGLAIEWSVWGGIGMGERLGVIERLERQGIDALAVNDALASFDALVESGVTGSIVIAGRFGSPPSLFLGNRSLPSLRFVDSTVLHHPGVELVLETTISAGRDRYLKDHMFDGEIIVPGVMLTEAMAQVAHALDAVTMASFEIEDVRFNRAVVVSARGTALRLAALKRMDGVVEAAVLSSEDGYVAAAATCAFRRQNHSNVSAMRTSVLYRPGAALSTSSLYGDLFFCTGKFARLETIETASAREVVARLGPPQPDDWFGAFESQRKILWTDPGMADATLHALQVTFPQRRLLPVGIKRICKQDANGIPVFIHGRETGRTGSRHFYDAIVTDSDGRCLETWEGIELVELRQFESAQPVQDVLAVPYLERLLGEEIAVSNVSVAMIIDDKADSAMRREEAMRRLHLSDSVQRAADGGWTVRGVGAVSVAHTRTITLVVAADEQVAFDIESSPLPGVDNVDALASHCRYEVHRKLGRRARVDELPALSNGAVTERDGVLSVVARIMLVQGPVVVAAGRLVRRRDGLAA
ncbi:type I polyketide synthase [Mesorhizobium sp. L-8-3]|uniref:type I polyketide synthase n=1 Tax=Mesorhizobium sp. L-8-3 TaxID=2744522 RepID=UPI00192891D8|nr:type I polyketide synthase [Mesorhizobium sp. L-8-3]BCH27806.1 polyketide synthase [Mesorhizobium sp. L-8-3]